MERKSGILLPLFALPSPYGIGTFGKQARRFVDFLAAAGQTYWQLLPLNPTSYGDSPYQSFSAFALNPYFIDLDILAEDGLLAAADLATVAVPLANLIDYGWIYKTRFAVLARAHAAFVSRGLDKTPAYRAFAQAAAGWLEHYAEFMVLKDHFGGISFQDWPAAIKDFGSAETRALLAGEEPRLSFYRFLQFEAFAQYGRLRSYAHSKNIKIIGDIPIYVALDSADVWSEPTAFRLDALKRPVWVAGVPPDYFSATGQLWGNPIYDYAGMEKDGFAWWKKRIKAAAAIYDVLRIDHFRGMADYWAVPFNSPDATPGHWEQGPGTLLVDAIKEAAGPMQIVAENLGVMDDLVVRLKEYSQWPGMHIFEFGFDGRDLGSSDLPANYDRNSVAYIGTHDNQTLKGFLDSHRELYPFIAQALRTPDPAKFFDTMIWQLSESVADTVVYTMQDVLRLGDEARLNTPSTLGGINWRFRLPADYDRPDLAAGLRQMAAKTGRL